MGCASSQPDLGSPSSDTSRWSPSKSPVSSSNVSSFSSNLEFFFANLRQMGYTASWSDVQSSHFGKDTGRTLDATLRDLLLLLFLLEKLRQNPALRNQRFVNKERLFHGKVMAAIKVKDPQLLLLSGELDFLYSAFIETYVEKKIR